MQRPRPPRWLPAALEAGALGLALAALLRWPVSVFPHAIPHDPNSALHMVAAADFAATLDPLTLSSLDWPDGVPVRLIGWPLLLLALPLELLLPPAVAFHGAVLLFLALQAAGVGAIRLEGWGRPQRLAAAAAATLAPIGLLFLGNGQPENVVFFPILLAGWAATRGRMGLVAAGLLLAALSTPYQGLVAGIFALCGAALRGARGILGVGAVASSARCRWAATSAPRPPTRRAPTCPGRAPPTPRSRLRPPLRAGSPRRRAWTGRSSRPAGPRRTAGGRSARPRPAPTWAGCCS